jgi:hypothetical protein
LLEAAKCIETSDVESEVSCEKDETLVVGAELAPPLHPFCPPSSSSMQYPRAMRLVEPDLFDTQRQFIMRTDAVALKQAAESINLRVLFEQTSVAHLVSDGCDTCKFVGRTKTAQLGIQVTAQLGIQVTMPICSEKHASSGDGVAINTGHSGVGCGCKEYGERISSVEDDSVCQHCMEEAGSDGSATCGHARR